MYSGKFPCSLIINKCKKKSFSDTTDYSVHIRTQINIDPGHFIWAPKIMPLLHRVEQWFHFAIYFGTICYRYQKGTGYNLYGICTW